MTAFEEYAYEASRAAMAQWRESSRQWRDVAEANSRWLTVFLFAFLLSNGAWVVAWFSVPR